VVKNDNTVELRPIETGTTTGDQTIVTSGVAGGERVVTDGQYKLEANAPVTIAPSRTADSQGNAT
jgi:membrane fusion protein, multidrug efflux system